MVEKTRFLADCDWGREALMWCALRLDVWRLIIEIKGQSALDLSPYIDTLVTGGRHHEDGRQNHFAFFALQRFLGKVGCEDRAPCSDERIVYRFLCMPLYRWPVFRGLAVWAGSFKAAPSPANWTSGGSKT